MTWTTDEGVFRLGKLALQSGAAIEDASIVWKSHGRLSPAKDNAILYPTSYSAQHADLEWLIGPDNVLDPTRWFILIPNMFGNGLSSSPSNTANYPPLVTAWDNVQAQHRLLRERFGIGKLACVYGWSMGAQQAYHWAAAFPDDVERIVVNCGSACTSTHNRVFLAGLMAILETAPEYRGQGRFSAEPAAAMRAFSRVYAGWGLSQDFYRAGLHLSAEAPDLETFLKVGWEDRFARRKAANLYAQLQTWSAGDISANPLYEGDLAKALSAIKAAVLLMPGASDLYFRVADNEAEARFLGNCRLRPIPSIWGHRAGNPMTNPADAAFIRGEVRGLLEQDLR